MADSMPGPDPSDMWQIGVVVEDLAAAMQDIGEAFDLTWAEMERFIDIDHEGVPKEITLRFAIAREGPVHLELIEGQEGSPWWPPHGFDHIAFWAEDLVANASRLESQGHLRQVSYVSDDGEPVGFTYHLSPGGFRVETVNAARRPEFMAWLEGDDYPSMTGAGS